jgi:hypothetical protein
LASQRISISIKTSNEKEVVASQVTEAKVLLAKSHVFGFAVTEANTLDWFS